MVSLYVLANAEGYATSVVSHELFVGDRKHKRVDCEMLGLVEIFLAEGKPLRLEDIPSENACEEERLMFRKALVQFK